MPTHLDTLHSKSMPSCRESTKQLALLRVERMCLAPSALFISFIIALALPVTSCLKDLSNAHTHTFFFNNFNRWFNRKGTMKRVDQTGMHVGKNV